MSDWASSYRRIRKFNDTITRVKLRIEQYVEERPIDRDGVNGAEFNLSNNIKGWSEKQEVTEYFRNDQNETNRSSKTLQNRTLKGNRENSARFVVRFTDRKKTLSCMLIISAELRGECKSLGRLSQTTLPLFFTQFSKYE